MLEPLAGVVFFPFLIFLFVFYAIENEEGAKKLVPQTGVPNAAYSLMGLAKRREEKVRALYRPC